MSTTTIESAIVQEINWHESNRGISSRGKDFEDGFIAGLYQSLYFERFRPKKEKDEFLLYCVHCERDTLTIDNECLWCGYKKESKA